MGTEGNRRPYTKKCKKCFEHKADASENALEKNGVLFSENNVEGSDLIGTELKLTLGGDVNENPTCLIPGLFIANALHYLFIIHELFHCPNNYRFGHLESGFQSSDQLSTEKTVLYILNP